jgi:hypothetical protein
VSGILCEHCTGVCCRYIALPIDTPDSAEEFDYLRWYLIHRGVSIFVEDDDWYICFQTTCQHLQADNRCGIYLTRPQICRSYSTDNCDYHSGDYGWQEHFTAPEHLDAYLAAQKARAAGAGRTRRPSRATGAAVRATRAHDPRAGVRAHPGAAQRPGRDTRRPGGTHGFVDRMGIPLPLLPVPEASGQ